MIRHLLQFIALAASCIVLMVITIAVTITLTDNWDRVLG